MRRAVLISVFVAVQILAPLPGSAQQVDPCEPVPIPELCDEEPLPNPTGSPSPPPPPEPVPGDGGGTDKVTPGQGGKEDGQGRQKKKKQARHRRDRPSPPTFFMGGPKNTIRLMSILSVLPRYGMPLDRAVHRAVGPFPVAGLAWWTDDWHACRDGCRRLHEGLDIFARHGTPLVAAADGVVTQKTVGGLAGIGVEIRDARGIEYFYAHLSGWADGLRKGMRVRRGQVIGYVGNTGNALSTLPHVHFEFQPRGVPRPPKPHVDRWLRMAEQRAIELVERVTGKPISKVTFSESDFRITRLFDLAGDLGSGDLAAEEMFLLAGLQPALPSLPMARQTVGQMAWEIDWGERAEAQLAALAKEYERLLAEQQLAAGLPLGLAVQTPPTGTQPAGGFD
jgi:murein DD-endopeptidase MepM/ murein hydrolase activator NlpD